MMAELVNGTSLNGPKEQFMSVSEHKQNGTEKLIFNSVVVIFSVLSSHVISCFDIRWYAKRFLHPDIVSAYEYVFIWDEDLGVEHFNAEEYVHFEK